MIHILAKCEGLVANCQCYGVLGAIAINAGGYKTNMFFDAGIYD